MTPDKYARLNRNAFAKQLPVLKANLMLRQMSFDTNLADSIELDFFSYLGEDAVLHVLHINTSRTIVQVEYEGHSVSLPIECVDLLPNSIWDVLFFDISQTFESIWRFIGL